MILVLHLPPETETLLKAQAEATGKTPEEWALGALEAYLDEAADRAERRSRRSGEQLTPEEWIADIRKWAESHRRLEHEAGDSRESIYEGRGE